MAAAWATNQLPCRKQLCNARRRHVGRLIRTQIKRNCSVATQSSKPSLARRWEDYQPGKSTLFWACAATVIATLIVGFNWGGWVTGGTSRSLAATAGDV